MNWVLENHAFMFFLIPVPDGSHYYEILFCFVFFNSLVASKPSESRGHGETDASRGYIVRFSVVASSFYSSFECNRWIIFFRVLSPNLRFSNNIPFAAS